VTDESKRLVEAGYDVIAERFDEWQKSIAGSPRRRYLERLLALLPVDPDVLELGSGGGVDETRALAGRGRLTGVDISAEQIRLARERVPSASFIHADFTELEFDPATFDAVVAFYSLIHVPREALPALFERIHQWLRPRGLLLATLGAHEDAGTTDPDWLGAPMFWSSYEPETNPRHLREAGFELEEDAVVTQVEPGYGDVNFHWVLARHH
jgi:ubiquinone/menaquinone biosynthesis C-methylase UbiE